jgi:hypothetical protein
MSVAWLTTIDLFDARPPQDVQAALERATDAVFPLNEGATPPTCAASIDFVGLGYRLALAFVEAWADGNRYRLDVAVEPGPGWTDHAAARRSADGWIALWCNGLRRQTRPPSGRPLPARHQALTESWRAEEARYADVALTQRRILDALRAGACFTTAHKEGGTTIRFTGRDYLSADHGESHDTRRFADEAGFLAYLRQFYDFQTSRYVWPGRVAQADAWRLILRQLRTAG